MEITALIALVTAALEIYKTLSGNDDQAKRWTDALETAKALGEKGRGALIDLYEDASGAAARLARAELARNENPAFRKSGTFLALLAVGLMATGCGGRLTTLDETPELRAGYAYEWPANASRNAADYHTSDVDGYMITTVPVEVKE